MSSRPTSLAGRTSEEWRDQVPGRPSTASTEGTREARLLLWLEPCSGERSPSGGKGGGRGSGSVSVGEAPCSLSAVLAEGEGAISPRPSMMKSMPVMKTPHLVACVVTGVALQVWSQIRLQVWLQMWLQM
jgi:hypothetical protein